MTTLFSTNSPVSHEFLYNRQTGYFPLTAANALEAFQPDPLFGEPRVPILAEDGTLIARHYEPDQFEKLSRTIAILSENAAREWPGTFDSLFVDDAPIAAWHNPFSPRKREQLWNAYVNDQSTPGFNFRRHRESVLSNKFVSLERPQEGKPLKFATGWEAYTNHAIQKFEIGTDGLKTSYAMNLSGKLGELAKRYGYQIKTRDRAALAFALAKDLSRLGFKNLKIRDHDLAPDMSRVYEWQDLLIQGATTLARADGVRINPYARALPEISFEDENFSGSFKIGVYNEMGTEGRYDEITWEITAKNFSREVQPLERTLKLWLWDSAVKFVRNP